MKRPLIGLAVIFAAGIWVGALAAWPVNGLYFAEAVVLAGFIALYRTRYSLVLLLAFVFVAGTLAYRHATANLPPNDITHLLPARDQNVTIRGVIVSDTGYREEANDEGGRPGFRLELAAVQVNGVWVSATGQLYAFVSRSRPVEVLLYGDEIECTALLRVPPAARNPGTLDWRAWLNRQGIFFTATLREKDNCRVLAHDRGNRLIAVSLRLRERFERALRLGLENEPKLAGVLGGLVIGTRSEIPPDTYAAFQRTGVFHVFSISGLNVTLVAAVAMGALRLLRVPRRWSAAVVIPVVVCFVLATGVRPGAVRALAMACVWLVGLMMVRPPDLLNSLGAAALAILVGEPAQLFDGGFVLSFSVVVALVLLTPPIDAVLAQWTAPDLFRPAAVQPWWRQWTDAPVRWLRQSVAGSLAAWVGLLPLMAFYFNLFSPVSILANIVAVPILGVITALGMIAMAAEAVWPWLTLTLNNANYFLLGTMIQTIEWLAAVPWGYFFVQPPPAWLVAAYYVVGLLWLTSKRWWWPVAAATLVGGGLVWSATRPAVTDVTVLDLNQGTVIFLDLPGERQDVLIDGGTLWSAGKEILPFLRSRGVDRLTTVLVTRGDKAHVEGLTELARQIPVGQMVHSGIPTRSKFYSQWLADMKALGVPVRTARAGAVLELGGAVRLRVLHPGQQPLSGRSEDNTMVVVVEAGTQRVLLMSDASEAAARYLLDAGTDLRAPVLVKGEHTRDLATMMDLTAAVQPAVVVQAVSSWPSRRYPRHEFGARVRERGIQYYRTDEAGAVTVRLRRDNFTVEPWLR